jgi:hypothetical protein
LDDIILSIPLIVGCDTTAFVVIRASAEDSESERILTARLARYEQLMRMFSDRCSVTIVVFGEEEGLTLRTVSLLQSHLEKGGKNVPPIVTVNPYSGNYFSPFECG